MDLTDSKKNEWEKTLLELNFFNEGDSIEEHTQGDYWTLFGHQIRGNFFFTKEKMLFVSGYGIKSFTIHYKDIKEIKKCMVGPFIPTGIKITVFDQNKGKEKKYKCSVLKRNNWIEFLSKKSGISCS